MIIDAKNATLGRMASFAAKKAIEAEQIDIVNCEDAIIIGKKTSFIDHYKKKRARGGSSLKGPFFPYSPERIIKRTIRKKNLNIKAKFNY